SVNPYPEGTRRPRVSRGSKGRCSIDAVSALFGVVLRYVVAEQMRELDVIGSDRLAADQAGPEGRLPQPAREAAFDRRGRPFVPDERDVVWPAVGGEVEVRFDLRPRVRPPRALAAIHGVERRDEVEQRRLREEARDVDVGFRGERVPRLL